MLLDEVNREIISHDEVIDAVIYPFSYFYGKDDVAVRNFSKNYRFIRLLQIRAYSLKQEP